MKRVSGVSLGPEESRFLTEMDRNGWAVFRVREHSELLPDFPAERLHKVVSGLAAKGRLQRIERGKYLVLPRAATRSWHEHPFVIAAGIAPSPSYITGWAALAHYDLTTQIPRVVHVALREQRKQPVNFQGTLYQFVFQDVQKFYGYDEVDMPALNGAANVSVNVASPVKALLDALDNERLAGGIGEIIAAVHRYVLGEAGEHHWDRVAQQLQRYPSRAAVARLGYILETLSNDSASSKAKTMLGELRPLVRHSGDYPPLSTTLPTNGSRPDSAWHLRVNVPEELFAEATV